MQPDPQYSQYPQYPPPPAKRKRRGRKILYGSLGLLAVIIIGSALASGGTGDTGPSGTDNAADANADATTDEAADDAPAGIGDEARDGKFAFTVTTVETADHVGDQFTRQNPQGQFVLVHVTVRNIGDEPQLFDASSQKLFDPDGRQYDADSEAAILGLPDAQSFLNNINPGNTVDGILLYDVPKGLAPASIELHDSPLSGGVTVTLSP